MTESVTRAEIVAVMALLLGIEKSELADMVGASDNWGFSATPDFFHGLSLVSRASHAKAFERSGAIDEDEFEHQVVEFLRRQTSSGRLDLSKVLDRLHPKTELDMRHAEWVRAVVQKAGAPSAGTS